MMKPFTTCALLRIGAFSLSYRRGVRTVVLTALGILPAVLTGNAQVSPARTQTPSGSKMRPAPRRPIANQYVVVLKSEAVSASGNMTVTRLADDLLRTHGGERQRVYEHALRGFSVRIAPAAAAALSNDARVDYVIQDVEVEADTVQPGATWGLDRIDQRDLPLNSQYTYDYTGAGVHAYVIDSGIRSTHIEFTGRIGAGVDEVGDGNGTNDCFFHGTHVAGILGGTTYGVAKGVTLHPVRVLGCSGTGPASAVIAGVDWVTANHLSPAVANMSLGSAGFAPLDDAITNSINSGVVYVVSAGNQFADDACFYSPARVPAVITVGASDISDTRSSFSNIGTCVDLFAPGTDVTSAYITGDSATVLSSGTSMAAPHVSGVAALYLSQFGSTSPAAVAEAIRGNSTSGRLADVGGGSPNLLVHSLNYGLYSLAASPNTVAPGDAITVNWTAPSGHSATDWVGLYTPGASGLSYLSFQYITSGSSGAATFTAPAAGGQYEFRLFLNDGFNQVATSNVVSVGAAYSLAASPSTVTAGAPISGAWAAPVGHSPTDWVGLYAVGAAETSFLSFEYISPATSGTVTLTAPAAAGSYELRLFTNNTFNRVATSGAVTVTSGSGSSYTLTASPSTVTAGGQVTVGWTAPGGRPPTDWVALYRVGDPNTAYVWWQYTNGAASGSVTITTPGVAGQYEFRYLQQDGFTDVAQSNAVTLTPAGAGSYTVEAPITVNAGGQLTVAWTAPGGRPSTDWVALYRVGAPNTAYTWWQYTTGAAAGTLTISAPGETGQYQFRYLQQDGFTDVARSNAVTVQ
jgi:serine protease